MNVYLAGTSVSNPEDELTLQDLFKRGYKLHSYYHLQLLEKKWFPINIKNKVKMFLDSGAFSAMTQGIEIDINEYIEFIKENKSFLEIYASLDVISVNAKPPDIHSAKASLYNTKIMVNAGLNPVPAFHIGEPFKYLEYYVKNFDYIALGVAGNSGPKLIKWMDECFSKYICDKNGIPKVKVHGFAVTGLNLMRRYPWYSVDSTSWVITGRMGAILIPRFINGVYDYAVNPWKINVSSVSPGLKEKGNHINTITDMQRDILLQYITKKGYKLGISTFREEHQDYQLNIDKKWASKKPKNKNSKRMVETIVEEGISNKYQLRDEMNIIYYQDLERTFPKWPWKFKLNQQKSLL